MEAYLLPDEDKIISAAREVLGLDQACVVSCDNIATIPTSTLGRQIGYLLPGQEAVLTAAIHAAFDLD
jgi:mRNA interferase MazF